MQRLALHEPQKELTVNGFALTVAYIFTGATFESLYLIETLEFKLMQYRQ